MAYPSPCFGCSTGHHEKHRYNFNNHPTDGSLIGGTYCDCKGDCEAPDLSWMLPGEERRDRARTTPA